MSLPPLANAPDGIDPEAFFLAADAVRDYCGWHIAPSITETVSPSVSTVRGRDLLLPTLHLTDVSLASADGVAAVVAEWEEFGVVRHPTLPAWSTRMRGNSITFTHGFTVCPPALAGAVASMASRGVTSLGVSRDQVGQVSRSYVSGASDGALGGTSAEMAIVRRYRIPPTL